MKNFLFLLVLTLSGALSGQPTVDPAEEWLILQQVQRPAEHEIRLHQTGHFNQAILQQTNPQLTEVDQVGDRNEANLTISGLKNEVRLRQKGDHNDYELNLDGDANGLYLLQEGSYNRIYQQFYNAENLLLGIVQRGDYHEIRQSATGWNTQGVPLRIEQQGTGMKIHIEH